MANGNETGPIDPRDLHLGKFAKPDTDPTEEGQTMVIRRSAVATAAKAATDEEVFEQEFGLPFAEMLGIVCHCYARGVFRRFADHLEETLETAYRTQSKDGGAETVFLQKQAAETVHHAAWTDNNRR